MLVTTFLMTIFYQMVLKSQVTNISAGEIDFALVTFHRFI